MSKNWIQNVNKSIEARGTKGKCSGSNFGSPCCPKGSKAYNLAKTFRKLNKKAEGGVSYNDDYEQGDSIEDLIAEQKDPLINYAQINFKNYTKDSELNSFNEKYGDNYTTDYTISPEEQYGIAKYGKEIHKFSLGSTADLLSKQLEQEQKKSNENLKAGWNGLNDALKYGYKVDINPLYQNSSKRSEQNLLESGNNYINKYWNPKQLNENKEQLTADNPNNDIKDFMKTGNFGGGHYTLDENGNWVYNGPRQQQIQQPVLQQEKFGGSNNKFLNAGQSSFKNDMIRDLSIITGKKVEIGKDGKLYYTAGYFDAPKPLYNLFKNKPKYLNEFIEKYNTSNESDRYFFLMDKGLITPEQLYNKDSDHSTWNKVMNGTEMKYFQYNQNPELYKSILALDKGANKLTADKIKYGDGSDHQFDNLYYKPKTTTTKGNGESTAAKADAAAHKTTPVTPQDAAGTGTTPQDNTTPGQQTTQQGTTPQGQQNPFGNPAWFGPTSINFRRALLPGNRLQSITFGDPNANNTSNPTNYPSYQDYLAQKDQRKEDRQDRRWYRQNYRQNKGAGSDAQIWNQMLTNLRQSNDGDNTGRLQQIANAAGISSINEDDYFNNDGTLLHSTYKMNPDGTYATSENGKKVLSGYQYTDGDNIRQYDAKYDENNNLIGPDLENEAGYMIPPKPEKGSFSENGLIYGDDGWEEDIKEYNPYATDNLMIYNYEPGRIATDNNGKQHVIVSNDLNNNNIVWNPVSNPQNLNEPSWLYGTSLAYSNDPTKTDTDKSKNPYYWDVKNQKYISMTPGYYDTSTNKIWDGTNWNNVTGKENQDFIYNGLGQYDWKDNKYQLRQNGGMFGEGFMPLPTYAKGGLKNLIGDWKEGAYNKIQDLKSNLGNKDEFKPSDFAKINRDWGSTALGAIGAAADIFGRKNNTRNLKRDLMDSTSAENLNEFNNGMYGPGEYEVANTDGLIGDHQKYTPVNFDGDYSSTAEKGGVRNIPQFKKTNRQYKEGKVYELTNKQIRELLANGGDVEFL